jgi:hypothetical protein
MPPFVAVVSLAAFSSGVIAAEPAKNVANAAIPTKN